MVIKNKITQTFGKSSPNIFQAPNAKIFIFKASFESTKDLH
jgi:hypothetical protein